MDAVDVLNDQIARLRAELAEAKAKHREKCAEVEGLREAIARYGVHAPDANDCWVCAALGTCKESLPVAQRGGEAG